MCIKKGYVYLKNEKKCREFILPKPEWEEAIGFLACPGQNAYRNEFHLYQLLVVVRSNFRNIDYIGLFRPREKQGVDFSQGLNFPASLLMENLPALIRYTMEYEEPIDY